MSMTADTALRAQLAHGSRDSRDVLAAMADLGLSPKQVRRAREKLGIVIERRGNGAAMRSTWCLPELAIRARADEAPVSSDGVSIKVSTRRPRPVRSQVRGQTPDSTAAPSAGHRVEGGEWSDAERSRHAGRAEAFARRGINAEQARQIADKLVLADREGRRAFGSCAQCSSLNTPDCVVARPLTEIHVCWLRRCAVN